jgi:hypothetical protein
MLVSVIALRPISPYLVFGLSTIAGCVPRCPVDGEGDGGSETGSLAEIDSMIASEADTDTEESTLPETPTLELSLSRIKQFEFQWSPAQGAEYYQLFERADEDSDYLQVGEDIVGESLTLTVPLHFRPNASYRLLACNALGCSESEVVEVEGSLAKAVGYFKASNTGEGDEFGLSVALSADGNTMAVGAWAEDSEAVGVDGDPSNDGAEDSGAVYVYARDDAGKWKQQAYVKPSNTESGDYFGWGVALSADGDVLAVSARREDGSTSGIDGDGANNGAADSGAVYVFLRGAMNGWTQQAYVKPSNTNVGDFFGNSLALSADGKTLAVGAHWERSSSTGIDGNQLDNAAHGAGAVYVYRHDAVEGWAQQAYVKASNTDAYDSFGWSVALSGEGDTLAVSAPGEDSSAAGIAGDQADDSAEDAGAVYVFEYEAQTGWLQQAYVKASNPDAYDSFGWSLALSEDGDTLAVGASNEASAALGIDGDQIDDSAVYSGAAYVFQREPATGWAQTAYLKASNAEAEDSFGGSIALSADARILVVGAYLEASNAIGIDGNQADHSAVHSGAAYVFQHDATKGWWQRAYVKASNTDAGDVFGSTLAISGDGNTLAVGAPWEASDAIGIGKDQTDDSADDAGAVYLY